MTTATPVGARIETALLGHDASGYPLVPAYTMDDAIHTVFWCVFCQAWHWHGRSDGHRVAHCSTRPAIPWHRCLASPCVCYEGRGYILQTVGPITRPVMDRYTRSQRRWLKPRLAEHQRIRVKVTRQWTRSFRRLDAACEWCSVLDSVHGSTDAITVWYQRGAEFATVSVDAFFAQVSVWQAAFEQEVHAHA